MTKILLTIAKSIMLSSVFVLSLKAPITEDSPAILAVPKAQRISDRAALTAEMADIQKLFIPVHSDINALKGEIAYLRAQFGEQAGCQRIAADCFHEKPPRPSSPSKAKRPRYPHSRRGSSY